jgi:Icc-related predicted phosphoesterase
MARLMLFSDMHGDEHALARAMAVEADAYFVAGDLVNWGRGLDKMAAVLCPRADRVYVLPGNHESAADIAAFCARHGFHDFHGQTLEMEGVHIAGLGYSSPTPFATPGEYSEEELAARLAPFAALRPLILICHAPPLDTNLDRIHEGLHGGSRAVRDFIEEHQPRHFFCGHIHEAEGVFQLMGNTQARNLGKRGFLLEWHRDGRKENLRGFRSKVFRWDSWQQPTPDWNHDHCMGCWATFAEPGPRSKEPILTEGWLTVYRMEEPTPRPEFLDDSAKFVPAPLHHHYRKDWVCPKCFDLCQEEFGFVVDPGHPQWSEAGLLAVAP